MEERVGPFDLQAFLDEPRRMAQVATVSPQGAADLRYVLFHMLEETARRAGHADIIGEALDGSRGT
jgi:hypothetical protein